MSDSDQSADFVPNTESAPDLHLNPIADSVPVADLASDTTPAAGIPVNPFATLQDNGETPEAIHVAAVAKPLAPVDATATQADLNPYSSPAISNEMSAREAESREALERDRIYRMGSTFRQVNWVMVGLGASLIFCFLFPNELVFGIMFVGVALLCLTSVFLIWQSSSRPLGIIGMVFFFTTCFQIPIALAAYFAARYQLEKVGLIPGFIGPPVKDLESYRRGTWVVPEEVSPSIFESGFRCVLLAAFTFFIATLFLF